MNFYNIGLQNMIKNKLIYKDVDSFVNDYDPAVDPSVYSEHASAAFRIFHSSIQGYLQYVSFSVTRTYMTIMN